MAPELRHAINRIKEFIKNNHETYFHRLKQFIGYIYTNSKIIKQKGYCGVFNIPYDTIQNFAKKYLGLDEKELKHLGVLLFDLGNPSNKVNSKKFGSRRAADTIYADPFYVFNLLNLIALIELYKETNNKMYLTYAKIPLFLIQAKLWNGRIKEYFARGCNPEVMLCVIKRLTKKSLVKNFSDPLDLITKYFVETLFQKYVVLCYLMEKRGLECFQRLFKQSWNRIKQIFSTSNRGDGEEEKRGGLAIKYYNAIKNGECKSAAMSQDAEEIPIIQLQTDDSRISELAEKIKHFIMLSDSSDIPDELINLIRKKTKVKLEIINKIPELIKKPEVVVTLSDIIAILIRKLELHRNRTFVCTPQFYLYADRLIQSKNNPEINHYKSALKEIAIKLIGEEKFNAISQPTKVALLRAINYIISYYVQEYICNNYDNEF